MRLEKLQKDYFFMNLGDWGTFYYKEDPLPKEEDQDKWLEFQGYWVSSFGIVPAILEKFIQIDGKNLEEENLFLFQVLDYDHNILASNI